MLLLAEEVDGDRCFDALVIRGVRVRDVAFLEDHWLYELDVST